MLRRLERYELQARARALLLSCKAAWRSETDVPRTALCLRTIIDRDGFVIVRYSSELNRATYGGLLRCHSLWTCPVCASLIAHTRAEEVRAVIDAAQSRGLRVLMASYTMRHRKRDKAVELVDDLLTAYRGFQSGKAWAGFSKRVGLAGTIRNLEPTWSRRDGHHMHLHVLSFVRSDVGPGDVEPFLQARWRDSLKKVGRRANLAIGCKVTEGDEHLAQYLTKLSEWDAAAEIAGGPSKSGHMAGDGDMHYTLLDLLRLSRSRSELGELAGSAWLSAVLALKRRSFVQFSPGLRAEFALGAEVDDGAIVDGDGAAFAILSRINDASWDVILERNAKGMLLEVVRQSHGNVSEVRTWLRSIGADLDDSLYEINAMHRERAGAELLELVRAVDERRRRESDLWAAVDAAESVT